MPPDEEILGRVYDPGYKTPEGFYRDPALEDRDATLYFHQPGWSATTPAAARGIVEAFLARPGGLDDKEIRAARQTERYFDFRAGRVWLRVHNPEYYAPVGELITSGLAFGPDAGDVGPAVVGTLKVGVTPEAVRGLAEYLWLIRHYNVGGAKVIRSRGYEDGGQAVAEMYTTTVVYGDFGLSDEIYVSRATFAATPGGEVTYREERVQQLSGRRN